MKFSASYLARIPSKSKKEYIYNACKLNLLRMVIMSAFVLVFESGIAIFAEEFKTNTFYLALILAAFQIVFIPTLYYMHKHIEDFTLAQLMAAQTAFLVFILTGGTLWSFFEQSLVVSGSTFMLAIMAIAALLIIPPLQSAILFASALMMLVLFLPEFQTNKEALLTLNINIISMTGIAWLLNQMIFKGTVDAFINEKMIIQKNKELEDKNRELNELTMRDSMTNLLNHKNSMRKLKEEIERAKRIDYPLSVAMIDLDNFKSVNDTYGHQAGDNVIIQMAKILKDHCRATDIIGRYGGEEFIIIMPDTNDSDAASLLNRIQHQVDEVDFKGGIHVTLSCVISELHDDSIHGILRASDLMLYEAKEKGKNRVEVFQLNKNKSSAAIN